MGHKKQWSTGTNLEGHKRVCICCAKPRVTRHLPAGAISGAGTAATGPGAPRRPAGLCGATSLASQGRGPGCSPFGGRTGATYLNLSGVRKLSRWKSSSRLFWSGVPVSSSL